MLVRDPLTDRKRPFDMLGFMFLAIAIGSFQLMLDRGQQLDWFDSIEIIVETLVAGVAFAMFLIHMMTDHHPFLSRDLFRDRNLSVGLILTGVTGLVLIVTATLMPPFLQQLKGYPVFTTGIVLAPRGAGMMVSMMLVSRLIGRFDARYMIALGFALEALLEIDQLALGRIRQFAANHVLIEERRRLGLGHALESLIVLQRRIGPIVIALGVAREHAHVAALGRWRQRLPCLRRFW